MRKLKFNNEYYVPFQSKCQMYDAQVTRELTKMAKMFRKRMLHKVFISQQYTDNDSIYQKSQ